MIELKLDYVYKVYQDSVLVDLAAGSDISSTKGLFWDLFLTVEFVELVQELLEQAEDEEMLEKKNKKFEKLFSSDPSLKHGRFATVHFIPLLD